MGTLNLRKGDTFAATLRFSANGVAKDMTGWSLEATMRTSNCPPVDLVASFTNQVGGVAKVTLAYDLTKDLEEGVYELRIRTIDPDDVRTSSLPITVRVRE